MFLLFLFHFHLCFHLCVTVNVCRRVEVWVKSSGSTELQPILIPVVCCLTLEKWKGVDREGAVDKNIIHIWYLKLLTVEVHTAASVHNTVVIFFFVCVTAVFCHLSGLCGRDAHPQGCSCGQSGVHQRSLDSGSKSWVSPVITPTSSFLFFCSFQHLSYTFYMGSPPNSNQSSDEI